MTTSLDELLKFESIRGLSDELLLLTKSEKTKQTYLSGLKYFMRYLNIEDLIDTIGETLKM